MTQQEAIAYFLPLIESNGKIYEKFTEIDARPAIAGEVIVTITGDGKETTNTAKEGDVVVRNLTTARELYILSGSKLAARYKPVAGSNNAEGWKRYKATGECQGLQYNGSNIVFEASWGENMVLKTGDMICTPLPNKAEIYRIAAKEFTETYRLK